jgi:hypothetical protein
VTLLPGRSYLDNVAVDGTSLYWSDGTLSKMPVGGGDIITLSSANEPGPTGIAIDGTYAYWTTSTEIRKVPLAGGTITTLGATTGYPFLVAVGDTGVYFTNSGTGTVMKVAK